VIWDIVRVTKNAWRRLFKFSTNRRVIEQPTPQVTAEDVNRVVRRDFPEPQFDEVMSLLNEYGSEKLHSGRSRVQLAALKLAHGNLEALRIQIDNAKQDSRDILVAAEYPQYWQRKFQVRELSAREQQKLIDNDWKQYERWLRG